MESKSDCHDNHLIPPTPHHHIAFTLLFLSFPAHELMWLVGKMKMNIEFWPNLTNKQVKQTEIAFIL